MAFMVTLWQQLQDIDKEQEQEAVDGMDIIPKFMAVDELLALEAASVIDPQPSPRTKVKNPIDISFRVTILEIW